jgi:protein-tyrosine phosphatase
MFIATQGPKENTQKHFWQMVIENNVNLIIMLCKLRENDRVK